MDSPRSQGGNEAGSANGDEQPAAVVAVASSFAPKMAPCDCCGVPVQVKPGAPLILCTKDTGNHRQFSDQASRAGKGQMMQDMLEKNKVRYIERFRAWVASLLGCHR